MSICAANLLVRFVVPLADLCLVRSVFFLETPDRFPSTTSVLFSSFSQPPSHIVDAWKEEAVYRLPTSFHHPLIVWTSRLWNMTESPSLAYN